MKKQYLAKRLFALILAVSVCAAAIPVPVRAEETTASQETDVSEETTASQETDVSEETAASEEETGQQDAFTLSEEHRMIRCRKWKMTARLQKCKLRSKQNLQL